MMLDRLPKATRALYPFQPKSFTTRDGHLLSYVDEGQGPVVVLVHGNPTWSFYFRDLITDLKQRHRVIVPDHLGMGLSDRPQEANYTLKTHAQNLQDLLESLDVKKPSLVVHDWGGAIGLTYAAQSPEGIDKLVVTNTAAFRSEVIPKRIDILRGRKIGEALVRGLNAFAWPATFMASTQKLPPAVKAGYLAPYSNWHERIGIARFVQDIPMNSEHPTWDVLGATEDALKTIKGPKLIAWGMRDFCFNEHFFKRWCDIYPEAEVLTYPEAGHYVLEDAGEHLRAELCQFLSREALS